jgi:hypothetical protein
MPSEEGGIVVHDVHNIDDRRILATPEVSVTNSVCGCLTNRRCVSVLARVAPAIYPRAM